MRKILWKKKVFQFSYIGLLMFFVLLIFSCATVSYDFIGTWNQEPGTLTYTNYDQHIKLTFPNDKWRVYTTFHKDLKGVWMTPTKDNSYYHVLIAKVPDLRLFMQVAISPQTTDVSMEDFLAIQKGDIKMLFGKSVEKINKT
ncbi:MAG: hypothetical protein GXP46_09955, partial [Deferribacteres bacterium]|nr:hypothetical protein [Deferribacteres bacterium]